MCGNQRDDQCLRRKVENIRELVLVSDSGIVPAESNG